MDFEITLRLAVMGSSKRASDLHVPKRLYERARDILYDGPFEKCVLTSMTFEETEESRVPATLCRVSGRFVPKVHTQTNAEYEDFLEDLQDGGDTWMEGDISIPEGADTELWLDVVEVHSRKAIGFPGGRIFPRVRPRTPPEN